MIKQYNIYYKNLKLVISNGACQLGNGSFQVSNITSPNEIPKILQLFISGTNSSNIFVQCARPKKALRHIEQGIKVIEAAGGLVKNPNGEYLLIYRRGHWDLPKGKIEKGESVKKAAKREVMEETGVIKPKIRSFITTTYHIYEFEGEKILKVSHWYHMRIKHNQELTPQTEEDIEIARWVNPEQLPQYLPKAYNNIVDVFEKA